MTEAKTTKLSEEKLREYREGLRKRRKEHRKKRRRRKQEAEKRAREIAERLYRFGAKEVWHFGSLATGTGHARSDLDIAVLGIAPGDRVEAYGIAESIAGPEFEVDLVRLEHVREETPSLAERIQKHGKLLCSNRTKQSGN